MMNHPTNHGSGPVPTTTPARPSKHRSTAERQTAPRRSTSAAVAIVTLAAAFAGLAIWTIAVPVADITLTAGGVTVSPAAVALVSLGSGCAAGISYSLMNQFRGGAAAWTVFGCMVLVVSMAGPLMSGSVGSALFVLELMHLVVGVTMILGLRFFVPRGISRDSGHESARSGSAPSTAVSE